MQIDKTQHDALSHKAVKTLGKAVVDRMSDAQVGLLNRALDRLLLKRKSVEAISPEEIEGQYEQIVRSVLPTGSHEHLAH